MRPLTLCLAAALIAAPAAAQSPWKLAPPTSVVPLGTFQDTTLVEASAAAASRSQPGVIWTLNDSGNAPWVYAVDTAGRTLGVFLVAGASNFDWESLTLSPCPAGTCIDRRRSGRQSGNPSERRSSTGSPSRGSTKASAGELGVTRAARHS